MFTDEITRRALTIIAGRNERRTEFSSGKPMGPAEKGGRGDCRSVHVGDDGAEVHPPGDLLDVVWALPSESAPI